MIKKLKFGDKYIGVGHPVLVIAEIGINHEGSAAICAKMIEAAKNSGADAVKLQTCSAAENYVKGTESYELFSKSELTQEETAQMFQYARDIEIEIFTTSPDPHDLEWVDRLNPAAHKISSGMMTNSVILKETLKKGRTVLISTGLAEEQDIDTVFETVNSYGNRDGVGLFQCTSLYPCPDEHLNLATINHLKKKYEVAVGFSDHSDGIETASYAVAAGARFIEKHFTLDKTRDSYDHRLSLEPQDMKEMVEKVRWAERMMGQSQKFIPEDLKLNRKKFLRCLIAKTDIKNGEVFNEDNIALKRPLPDKRGLDPKFYYDIMGKKANRDIDEDTPILTEYIE